MPKATFWIFYYSLSLWFCFTFAITTYWLLRSIQSLFESLRQDAFISELPWYMGISLAKPLPRFLMLQKMEARVDEKEGLGTINRMSSPHKGTVERTHRVEEPKDHSLWGEQAGGSGGGLLQDVAIFQLIQSWELQASQPLNLFLKWHSHSY